jgi:hypothetical protein
MISTDDLDRIKAYASTVDPSLLSHQFFFQSPSGDDGGVARRGTVAPGGSVVGGAGGTGDSGVNQSHAGIFGPAPTPT